MTNLSVAHRDATDATVFAGLLAAIGRDPSQWRWPASTAAYLQHRIDTLARELVRDGATETAVA